jgi:hypothetical protein
MNVVGMEAIYHDSSLNRRRMEHHYTFTATSKPSQIFSEKNSKFTGQKKDEI